MILDVTVELTRQTFFLIKWKPPLLFIEMLLLLHSYADQNVHPLDEPASAESEAHVSVLSWPKSSPLFECILTSGLFYHSVILPSWCRTCWQTSGTDGCWWLCWSSCQDANWWGIYLNMETIRTEYRCPKKFQLVVQRSSPTSHPKEIEMCP